VVERLPQDSSLLEAGERAGSGNASQHDVTCVGPRNVRSRPPILRVLSPTRAWITDDARVLTERS